MKARRKYLRNLRLQISVYWKIFAVVIKTKEFKNMFTQFNKLCMHIPVAYGSTYWYSIEKRIGSVWLKHIGNVWLKRIGREWLKGYW